MTAEIAIMNKSAVALAADSAATIQSRLGQKRVFNTVNKVFMLSKYHPIGIMIYNGAELMGVPWETIIKIYRQQLGDKPFKTTLEYAKDFINFLEKENSIFNDKIEAEFFSMFCYMVFSEIRERIEKNEQEQTIANWRKRGKPGKIPKGLRREIQKEIIDQEYTKWRNLPKLPNIPTDYNKQIGEKYDSLIVESLDHVFKGFSLAKYQRNHLVAIAKLYFTKDHFGDGYSGIVIAGFGEDQIFPSLVSVQAECIILNILKHKYEDFHGPDIKIDINNSATIVPFAQMDMINTFIYGIGDDHLDYISGYFVNLWKELPDEIVRAIPPLASKLNPNSDDFKEFIKRLKTKIHSIGDSTVNKFETEFDQWTKDHYSEPLIDAVSVLPKDELAALAESLISITSLKRKVSLEADAETVGGAVDVAVISKGDGFVWIKRKHYFKSELNPYFINQTTRFEERTKREDKEE